MLVRPARSGEADELARQYARMAEEGWIAGEPPVDIDARAEPAHAKGVMTFGMAVMPEARGTGGGRALIERIVGYAREQGCHKIELEVWIDNARAISLYATSGFEVEGLKRDPLPSQGRLAAIGP